MASFYPAKPPLVRPVFSHPILRGQTCWVVAGQDRNTTPADPLIRGLAARTLGAGVTYGDTAFGSGYKCDGGANGYVDLGSTNRFLPSDGTPFTVAWIECYTGAGTEAGVLGIFPTGAAEQFICLRISHDTVTPTTYGRFACGPWKVAGGIRLPSFLGPPRLSDSKGITHACLLTGTGGTGSQDQNHYIFYMDGVKYLSTGGGNTANLGSTNNWFGWDDADSKWTGVLDNLRIWSRVLSKSEIDDYFDDPYIGAVRAQIDVAALFRGGAAVGSVDQTRFELAA